MSFRQLPGAGVFRSIFRRGRMSRAAALLGFSALCACGGGGGGTVPPPGPGPTATPGPSTASVTFTLLVPKAAQSAVRRPKYVSSATQSIRITVNGGTPVVVNVGASAQGCTTTAQGLQCTVTAPAPVGTDSLFVELFGQPGAGGPVLSQGTSTATVVAGGANNVVMTLNGVVAKVTIVLGNSTPQQGTAATIPLTVTLQDAAGATIIGDPFVNPVTLTDSDTSGATSISRTTITSPADASGLTVSYNGAAIASATIGATGSGVAASNVVTATLTPRSGGPPPTSFVDWTTYAYDNRRDGFNPNANALTPSSLAQLHLAWQTSYNNDYNTQTQPVLATGLGSHAGLLFVGGSLGIVYAFDALTGSEAWRTPLGNEDYTCASGDASKLGVGGTVTYDPASRTIYVPHNSNSGQNTPASNAVVRLDAATGASLGRVEVAPSLLSGEKNFVHTGVALSNGQAYVGTSATCDVSSWRGRVASVNANMTGSPRIFYTTYGRGGNFSGGGVWGWGGVAIDDAGQVYAGVGNADNTTGSAGPLPPFDQTTDELSGLGDQVIQLSSDLSALVDANNPGYTLAGNSDDLDLGGSPVLFRPVGCTDMLLAAQGKAGELLVYDTRNLHAGPVSRFRISPSSNEAGDIGNPAWSPVTGLLYVSVNSGTGGSIDPPGMIALRPAGCNSATTLAVAWHTAFGPDSYSGPTIQTRSAPTVTAGGVVIEGTPCTTDGSGGCTSVIGSSYGGAVWALDAATGALLNGGKPLLITIDHIRMPAVVDGNWVFVEDHSATLYGLTLDPNVPKINAVRRAVSHRPNWYMRHH